MVSNDVLLKACELMYTAKVMAKIYEANRVTCKYVHST
jgi:2-oxoisovalerate dehydrogenase E1 component